MYTMRRREQELEAQSKDSFYKKLKVRIGQTDPEREKPNAKAVESAAKTPVVTSTNVVVAPSTGVMRFGFGMMPIKQDPPSTIENVKEKKSKKDKKDKDKKDKDKKDK
ncbi:hypothetical protein GGI21_005912, partial [Coemansia aciculifera]